jgi:polysaccharide export outer membrane protein
VEGLTRRELAAKLEKDLLPYMKEPIVNVNYLNHKVTVIGEVGGAQVLPMPEEQLSLLEVLVKSGGVTANGLKNNVMIIRDQGTSKQVKHINMEDHALFGSEWFYVKPNDIVYVKADDEKRLKAEKTQKVQTTISLVMTGLSFFFIVIDRIFR